MAADRVFKVELRTAVAQRILNGESVSSLSRQYKIKRSLLYRWREFCGQAELPLCVRATIKVPAPSVHISTSSPGRRS
jgi:transposase-like protein